MHNRIFSRLLSYGLTLLLLSVLVIQSRVAFADTGWNDLNPQARELLSPLRGQWNSLSEAERLSWQATANRYEQAGPEQKERMRGRIAEWSQLSPSDKQRARENYKALKDQNRGERNSRWNEYQTRNPKDNGKGESKGKGKGRD